MSTIGNHQRELRRRHCPPAWPMRQRVKRFASRLRRADIDWVAWTIAAAVLVLAVLLLGTPWWFVQ